MARMAASDAPAIPLGCRSPAKCLVSCPHVDAVPGADSWAARTASFCGAGLRHLFAGSDRRDYRLASSCGNSSLGGDPDSRRTLCCGGLTARRRASCLVLRWPHASACSSVESNRFACSPGSHLLACLSTCSIGARVRSERPDRLKAQGLSIERRCLCSRWSPLIRNHHSLNKAERRAKGREEGLWIPEHANRKIRMIDRR
jgi:hypothetical protein